MNGQIKRNTIMIVLVGGLLSGAGLLPAGATVILDDNFVGTGGNPPNPANWEIPSWTAPNTVQLDNSGSVTLNGKIGGPMTAIMRGLESFGFQPTTVESARLTVQGLAFNSTPGSAVFLGLLSASPTFSQDIYLENNQGSFWTVRMDVSGSYAEFDTDVSGTSGGDWVLDWYENRVVVSYEGVLKLDTSVTSPLRSNTGGNWVFPNLNLRPEFEADGRIASLDRVTWESVVPEPSMVMLLAVGGLMLWRHRRTVRA